MSICPTRDAQLIHPACRRFGKKTGGIAPARCETPVGDPSRTGSRTQDGYIDPSDAKRAWHASFDIAAE